MAWFAIAALCITNVCTVYALGENQGYDEAAPCEAAIVKHMFELPLDETMAADGDVRIACLPLTRIQDYTPEQLIEWLHGNAPGTKS